MKKKYIFYCPGGRQIAQINFIFTFTFCTICHLAIF